MCRQFLVPPFQILVNQNWKSWPDKCLGRLWILRDAFSGSTSESGRQRVRFDRSERLTGDFETRSKSISPIAAVGTTSRPAKWIKPQLTRLVDEAPAGRGWLHEVKNDGYRMHARIDGRDIKLLTRTGLDWSHRSSRHT
jgi:hypothetical protein